MNNEACIVIYYRDSSMVFFCYNYYYYYFRRTLKILMKLTLYLEMLCFFAISESEKANIEYFIAQLLSLSLERKVLF